MPGPVWGEDSRADEAVIAANVVTVLTAILTKAAYRTAPTIDVAHTWHRLIHRGVRSVPAPHYLGEVRGSTHPDLLDYEVVLADGRGTVIAEAVPASRVQDELAKFQTSLHNATASLDRAIAPGDRSADTAQLLAVVELAASAHGDWVRIHPYANGNGRTARTWANWVAVRYGLPPFVRIRPRPDGLLYGEAARRSLGSPPSFVGDHRLTVQVFVDLLRAAPKGAGSQAR